MKNYQTKLTDLDLRYTEEANKNENLKSENENIKKKLNETMNDLNLLRKTLEEKICLLSK